MQYLKGENDGAGRDTGTHEKSLNELMRERETPESSRDSDVCPICHGSEWILVKKNGVEAAKPCQCRERAVMSRRLRFADIPEAFRGMDLKTFRMDVYRNPDSKKRVSDACKIIKTYLEILKTRRSRAWDFLSVPNQREWKNQDRRRNRE